MNVPFKNITKVDTSKGVPVWLTNMHDIRSFAEVHNAPADKTAVMQNLTELNGLIELIKKNFLNGRDIGSNAIILSIACINFLSIKSPNATCSAFLDYIVHHKFGGVAYTGNSAKIVTVTRDDQVPAMLPFVLRDNDSIVAGYGVYIAAIKGTSSIANHLSSDRKTADEFIRLFLGIEIGGLSESEAEEKIKSETAKMEKFTKFNTLYHDYPVEDKPAKNTVYILFSMRRGKVLDLVDMKIPGVEICPHPILTIATHNTTLE